jgi:hypothetical protein
MRSQRSLLRNFLNSQTIRSASCFNDRDPINWLREADDLRWISGLFLNNAHGLPCAVVHGLINKAVTYCRKMTAMETIFRSDYATSE